MMVFQNDNDKLLFWYNLNQPNNLNLAYDSNPNFNFNDLILMEIKIKPYQNS